LLYGFGEEIRDNYAAGLAGFVIWLILTATVSLTVGPQYLSKGTLVLTAILTVAIVIGLSSVHSIKLRIDRQSNLTRKRTIAYDIALIVFFLTSFFIMIKNHVA
jgi:hypothetical protein